MHKEKRIGAETENIQVYMIWRKLRSLKVLLDLLISFLYYKYVQHVRNKLIDGWGVINLWIQKKWKLWVRKEIWIGTGLGNI